MQYVFEFALPSEVSERSGTSASILVLQMRLWNIWRREVLRQSGRIYL